MSALACWIGKLICEFCLYDAEWLIHRFLQVVTAVRMVVQQVGQLEATQRTTTPATGVQMRSATKRFLFGNSKQAEQPCKRGNATRMWLTNDDLDMLCAALTVAHARIKDSDRHIDTVRCRAVLCLCSQSSS